MKRSLVVVAVLALMVGCSDSSGDGGGGADAGDQPESIELSYNFADGAQGWEADVSQYPNGARDQLEFVGEVQPLPSEIDESRTAYYLKVNNTTESAFLFLKHPLGPDDGLEADTDYTVNYKVTYATNYPADCTEKAGQKMYMKMGGSTWEPANILSDDQSQYKMNVRVGDNVVGGDAASTAGDLTHDEPCADVVDTYIEATRNYTHTRAVTTTADGNMWLLFGVDSGYLGETSFYVESLDVTITAQ